jgi:radical SAM superfamily enzyme YgiQ (UPF0313 family)
MAHILFVCLFDEWCLGVRSLSAVLRKQGHRTSLLIVRDMNSMNDKAGEGDPEGYHNPPASLSGQDVRLFLNKVRELEPSLVGFSFMSNFHGLAKFLTRRLKQELPDLPIVWGGSDTTINPDLAIREADYICRGEGEEALPELVAALQEQCSTDAIANIWTRHGDSSQGGITWTENTLRPTEKEIDKYPFPDFSRDGKWYLNQGHVEEGVYPPGGHLPSNYPTLTSRGCPYSCSFCCNSNYRALYGPSHYVRRHSVDYVIREIKHHRRLYPEMKFVEFHDDVFTFNSVWLKEFSEVYRQEIGLPFFAYTHPLMCRNEDLAVLKKAGWEVTAMGIQSGSQKTLQVFDRKMGRERMLESARQLLNSGIKLVIDLIGSNPLENDASMNETFELLLDMPAGFVLHDVNPLAMYRNFEITRIAAEKGLLGKPLPDRNAWLAPDKAEYHFWSALWSLAQFPQIPRETLRQMARDPYLKEHPEILEAWLRAYKSAVYVSGSVQTKDHRICELENQLASFNGSRLVQIARKLQGIRQHWLSFPGKSPDN